ncbi:MAG: hypothetical protein KC543_08260 [Myxococcales bacterium]|nr:hypothetical protein [Myxococcales bacterium]
MGAPIYVPSLADEVREYREMTPAQRAAALRAVCRAGARMALSRPDAERVLCHRDRLPDSSVRALARLRRQAAGS